MDEYIKTEEIDRPTSLRVYWREGANGTKRDVVLDKALLYARKQMGYEFESDDGDSVGVIFSNLALAQLAKDRLEKKFGYDIFIEVY